MAQGRGVGRSSAPPDGPGLGELLPPDLLAAIATLRLRTRAVAQGAMTGLHRSPRHGRSVEFSEYQEYSSGDDVRSIDWRAYGRLDRYYVRRFEQETHSRGELLLDSSASMGYSGAPVGGSPEPSKLRFVTQVAAALAYLLVRQQDAVGLTLAGPSPPLRLPARGTQGHLRQLLRALAGVGAQGRARLDDAALMLGTTLRQRSLVVAFSDLLGGWQAPLARLGQLRARGHEVALMHVLHPDELTFPFQGATEIEELEPDGGRTERWLVEGEASRARYLERLGRYLDDVRGAAVAAGVRYQLVSTGGSVIAAVQRLAAGTPGLPRDGMVRP
jgi:uncharacterized protein (DUF58 family)